MRVLRSGTTHLVIRGDLARVVWPGRPVRSAVPVGSAMAHLAVPEPWQDVPAPWPDEVAKAAEDGPEWSPPDWAGP